MLQILMPHLRRALMLHVQLMHMRSSTVGLETALSVFDHAVLGLDQKSQVMFLNRQAEQILMENDGLSVANGRMTAFLPELNRPLQSLVSNAVATGAGCGGFPGGSMLMARKSGKSSLRLTVTPVSAAFHGCSVRLAALVFLSDPAKRILSRGDILRALYGLTPAEARVADHLSQGLEVREVAGMLGMTLETGRFHVKRILSKTGVRRQAELVRLMLSLPGLEPVAIG